MQNLFIGKGNLAKSPEGQHIRRLCWIVGINPDAAAVFAGFEEFDVRLKHAPIGDSLWIAIDLHVVKNTTKGVRAMLERFGIAVVDDAAVVDEQQGIAHLPELGKDVG